MKKLKSNSNIFKIIKAFCVAFFISNSIYFSKLQNFYLEILSPFIAIYGFVLLLRSDGKGYFWAGFFLSLMWFYWMSLSSIYYGLHYIIPFELIGIGLFYGVLFRLCYALRYDFLRLAGIFCLPFIHFLGFDWLNWGVLSVYGFFDASWRGIICIFLIAYFWYEGYISKYYKIFIIVALFFIGMQYQNAEFTPLKSDIKLINTHIDEASKFQKENVAKNADFVVSEILQAINEQKELIVFPESTFAFELKKGFGGMYYELLKEFSTEIDIVVGAPYADNGRVYNSAYIFQNGEVKVLSKYHLVPFGEEMPKIPYVSEFVRQRFLPNMSDFARGAEFNEYDIGTQRVTSAICYEATKEELYKKSKIIIAISNNAWFDNFVEPALQKLLIKFYASKYGVVVYHATNAQETAIITPKQSLFLELKAEILGENSTQIDENASQSDENSNENNENSNADLNDDENLSDDENIADDEIVDENSSADLTNDESEILENDEMADKNSSKLIDKNTDNNVSKKSPKK